MRTHPDGLKHIRSLKDLVEVRAHPSADTATPGSKDTPMPAQPSTGPMADLTCPISQLPFVKNRVALLVSCGHVFCHR